jgi:hypothetical protein
VKVDGEFYELEDPPKLDKKLKHDIDVVVDRIVVKAGMEQRSPKASRPRWVSPMASRSPNMRTRPRSEGRRAKRSDLLRQVRLPGLGLHHPEIEPRCSRSTIRSAPARPATAWGRTAEDRRRSGRAGPRTSPERRRDRALGANRPSPL